MTGSLPHELIDQRRVAPQRVSIAGVSDLIEMLNSERREEGRGSESYRYWLKAIGNPSDDRDELIRHSPARNASAVRAPLLLIHSDADDIVPIEQSMLMQAAMERAGKPTRLVTIEGAGHNFYDWSAREREALYDELTRFLGAHLDAASPPPPAP